MMIQTPGGERITLERAEGGHMSDADRERFMRELAREARATTPDINGIAELRLTVISP